VNQEEYASLMLSHNSEKGIPNIIKESYYWLMFIKNYGDMKLNLSVASHHIYKRSLTCLEWKRSWCGNKLLTKCEAMLMQAMMSRMDRYQAKYWFS
jgi:3-deoxy-D-manno-octulosonic-acid transferase